MESETQTLDDAIGSVEFEDLDLSDLEENLDKIQFHQLNIDSNSRIVSKKASPDYGDGDKCDMHFQDGAVNFQATSATMEEAVLTSDEEVEISEEDIESDNRVMLKHLNPEGVACVAAGQQSDSSMNFSSTSFKDECATNEEDISDEDAVEPIEYSGLVSRQHKKLTAGVAVTNVLSAVKKMSPGVPSKVSAFSTSFSDLFSDHLSESENDTIFSISDLNKPNPKKGLITCEEFLSVQPREGGLTDTEEFSADSSPESDPGDSVKKTANLPFGIKQAADKRSEFYKKAKKVALVDGLYKNESTDSGTDDEILCVEMEDIQLTKRTRKKHLKSIQEKNIDNANGLTDEEEFEALQPEWTETDESGAIRQVTQIKTETSIKLDSEEKDEEEDGDDLISRTTATTTTRIVTTVTSEGGDEVADDPQSALDSGDDLRHSVEIILNQFMSDDQQQEDPSDTQSSQKE